jgi:L-ascorbate metabolism protein UlaG (beta-lactamase superfamily)
MESEDAMLENVKWLGQSSIVISGEKAVYIDPFQIKGGEPADLILITHGHYDHFSPQDIEKIKTAKTTIVMPASIKTYLPGNIRMIKIGEKLIFDEVIIEAVPAYNLQKSYHPRSNNNVGYLITMGGVRYYHAGDTDLIPEMNKLACDIAFLPIGGTFTMSATDAARAAELIRPRYAIPIHYGSVVGSPADAQKFKNLCSCEVVILPKGA